MCARQPPAANGYAGAHGAPPMSATEDAFVKVSSRTQSTVAPDSFTTLAHLAVSALMKAAN
jgi:hypothetical protein